MEKKQGKNDGEVRQEEHRQRTEKRRNFRGDSLLVCAGLALFACGGALLFGARKALGFAQWYSETIYPVLVNVLGRFWGMVPFSVVEIGLYGLIGTAVFLFWRFWRKPGKLLSRIFFITAVLVFLYSACCGVNYYRLPFSFYYLADYGARMEGTAADGAGAAGRSAEARIPQAEASPVDGDELLRQMCRWLTESVNEARTALSAVETSYEKMPEKGIAAMENLAVEFPALKGYYPRPKPVLLSWILSVQQYSGVYSPFTVEANYNRAMVDYNIPHTICHEMSHLRGFMREDEANFIGYLACLRSEDADFRYSGYLLGWIYGGNALAKVDYEEYVRLYGELSEEVRADLAANSAFWNRYEGKAAEVASQINDTYLKANGQAEGVKTYGRVVDLMLLEFMRYGKNPRFPL